jgi:Spy/CpxP family protein refolding chaperone
MKRVLIALSLLAVVGLVAGQLWAEGGDAPADKPKKVRKPRPPRKPTLRGAHAQMAKVCELSEEQVKKIADLNAASGKALKEWNEANAEKLKAANGKVKAAREAKDREAMKKASEELNALRKEQAEITKKYQGEIMAVLDDEQKAKWKVYNALRTIRGRFRSVKLSDDQLAKIQAICKELGEDLGSSDGKKHDAALRKLTARVEKEVLTEEQRLELAMGMIKRMFRKAELTEEQLTKIKAGYVKHMSGVDLADAKAKSAAMRKLYTEIRTDILTEEQRKAMGVRERKPAAKPKKSGD